MNRSLHKKLQMLLSTIQKIDPESPVELAEKLSALWEEVINKIVEEMLSYAELYMGEIHINIREEMILELATLTSFVADKVVSSRMAGRSVIEIDYQEERKQCFSEEGISKISATAKMLADNIWIKKYNVRWKPKTEFELKKEIEGPKATRLVPKRVKDNHFIPKSFIKKYWAEGQFVFRSIKSTNNAFKEKIRTPLGRWGFVSNLYSDSLEAYFSLLEGDATEPLRMLLNTEPLNRPQRDALIAFVVIQRIRNPQFINSLMSGMSPLVESEVGVKLANDKTYMQRVYESVYSNNDFYDKLARPILKSRWVMVRSKTPDFILPDVCNLFGFYMGKQYVFMPLTPSDCLVVLPVEGSKIRIVPHDVKASEEMTKNIAYILYAASKNEFLSANQTSLNFENEDQDKVIQSTLSSLISMTTSER